MCIRDRRRSCDVSGQPSVTGPCWLACVRPRTDEDLAGCVRAHGAVHLADGYPTKITKPHHRTVPRAWPMWKSRAAAHRTFATDRLLAAKYAEAVWQSVLASVRVEVVHGQHGEGGSVGGSQGEVECVVVDDVL